MTTTPVSSVENRAVLVGKVPADGGTICLRPSEPAMARTGIINRNRPTSMQRAPVTLNQSVLPLRPAKAEPLLLDMDVNAYVISVRPCGPLLLSEFNAEFITTEIPVKPRTTT